MICDKCMDAARDSLVQEFRGVLKARGQWVPPNDSDLIMIFAQAIDAKVELDKVKKQGDTNNEP